MAYPMNVSDATDVVVVGSGGAGLLAACLAADAGRRVTVLESTDRLGGTTAVSGGMIWAPENPMLGALGLTDSGDAARRYLKRVTEGAVPDADIDLFLDTVGPMVDYLLSHTPVRVAAIDRPDYHSDWPGALPGGGRCLDVLPYATAGRPGLLDRIRVGPHFTAALTYDERQRSRWPGTRDETEVARRERDGVVAVGAGLVAGLVAAADDRGVRFRTGTPARGLLSDGNRITGVRTDAGDLPAALGVVLASGGFEWNTVLRRAFLREPASAPVSPPGNRGAGLVMAMAAGAALDAMSDAWWAPIVQDPGETYDGEPLTRHLVAERCLPGSILVDRTGRRFVNEAVNYNDITRALHAFDPTLHRLRHSPAYLVFDDAFRRRYAVGGTPAGAPPPGWWRHGTSLAELAKNCGVDENGLVRTVAGFNTHARDGHDPEFGRGETEHDRYYGDDRQPGNPCLGPIEEPPYHAVEVRSGMIGTKGGVRTGPTGAVLRADGSAIPGLYACGNVAAGPMGPGYPGSGATLAAALTGGYRCGRAFGPPGSGGTPGSSDPRHNARGDR
ncbi:FAD-dependent oxidoreductase [Micromonospora sp. HNM0581]|nr:FAD-dependent oxidoreductase [Micromonospora sp. HNM0581]